MRRLAALWPALLWALAAAFTGGFASAARFPNAWIGYAAILATALAGAEALADPLRLGAARWLLWAAAVGVGASVVASDLERAGRVGWILLPAFLLLPAATARLLHDDAARRLAVAALSAAVAGVSAWALVEMASRGGDRAAAPLGHHNLLAVCLAMSLPIAAVGWRQRGAGRGLAAVAVVLGVGALAATRSLTGLMALGAAAWVASRRSGRARDLLTGVALLGLGLAVPRLEAIVRGADASAAARAVYLRGAWAGALERPMLGWGPGTMPWTLAGFVAPRPGVNPPGELVGDAHSTPIGIAFELGWPTLALAAAAAFAFARARWRAAELADPTLALAGQSALAAGVVALAGGAWLDLPAVPISLLLAAGFALAGEAPAPPPSGHRSLVVLAYVFAAGAALTPLALAHRAYESARTPPDAVARSRMLADAMRLDPAMPLYRARIAWGESGAARPQGGDWRELRRAASAARAVAPLWLRTAALAYAAGEPAAARQASARAMAFDPLGGAAPFLAHLAQPRDVDCAARALLGEPKLAAATWWRGRESSRRRVLQRVVSWEGVPAGWRREFVRQALGAAPGGGVEVDLVTRVDGEPALASSLFLFRRSPWPAELARFRLDRDAARRIDVPRACELGESLASAFPARTCAPD